MPSFPTIDLTIEDFAGLLGGDKDKIQQPPVQQEDAVPAASVPDPGAGGGQVPSVNINLQLPLRPAFPQGRRTNMFTVKPGFTPINRSEPSGSLKAKFRATTDAMPSGAPAQTGDISTSSRFKSVINASAFDFNAPMEPVSRNPSQLDHIRGPPAFDFNTPLEPAAREALRTDPIRDVPVIENNTQLEATAQEPTDLVNLDQVAAEEPQVRSCQTKDWICSSTIQIRDHVSALEFANDLCQSKDVGVADNKLVIWTDGSGQHNNTATSAAIVYRQPHPDPGPSCWVARGFGIMGYAGGAMLAESVAVAVALEAALDLWITLNNKRGQLGPRSHAGPAPIWIKQLTPSQPARPPVPRRPLPFSFIDLTVDDGPAVEVIDLTGDDSDDSMPEVLPAPTPVAEKEPVTESVKPFQELHILCDAQSVLTSSLMGIVRRKSATWDFISARVKGLMQQLFEKGVVVHFHWVPGHSGIEGNERADHVCGVVNKAMMRMPTRAPGQRVWEIEGLSESFAQGPGFNPQLCNVKRRRHFEMKQRKAISKWSLRPALRKQQREDLREVRRRYRKRNKHIGPVAPDEETVRHGEPRVTEERASGLGMPLRRSVRLAASLIAKESGNTMANAIEIID